MVATRRSLGGQPSPATSSPPAAVAAAATPAQLSRAQQAALKKLDIAGTDALRGDAKAAAAAKEQVQTYHYRGAVYAADANTPSSWIENQPKRYLKRSRGSSAGAGEARESSTTVEEEEEGDEEDEEEVRHPAKKHKGRNHKPAAVSSPATITFSRGKARPARGGRLSLPTKRKAAALEEDDDDDMDSFDYTVSGGQDDRVCLPRLPHWLPQSAAQRKDRLSHRANAVPASKSPIPDTKTMNSDIQRLKQEAMRKKYQVEALRDDQMMDEKELARAQLAKLAMKQRLLREKMLEWKTAKELLEVRKKQTGLKDATSDKNGTASPQPSDQPTVDLTRPESNQEDEEDALHQQWQREQSQSRAHNKPEVEIEIPETSLATQRSVEPNQPHDPSTQPGASRPQTPLSTHPSTILTGANAFPHPTTRGYTPTAAPAPTPSTGGSASKASSEGTSEAFANLPPNSALPKTSAGGHPLRWTIQRRASIEPATGQERAEYAIDCARLQGESKSAKIRRVRRERAIVEKWAELTGGTVTELGGQIEGQ